MNDSFKSMEQYETEKMFQLLEAKKEEKKEKEEKPEKEDKKEEKPEKKDSKKPWEKGEKKDDKKSDKKSEKKPAAKNDKVISKEEAEAEKKRFAEEEQKDLEKIFKKIIDNFKSFKITSGGKLEEWKEFVQNNLFKGSEPKCKLAYKLWNTNYTVGICVDKNGKKAFMAYKGDEEEPEFTSNNQMAIKKWNELYKSIVEEVKSFKIQKTREIEMQKKQEMEAQRKSKIEGFLKA